MNLIEKADEIWLDVCAHVDLVLKECDQYGIEKILVVPNPSLQQRIFYLELVEGILALIEIRIPDGNSMEKIHRNHSVKRNITNTLQQIGLLKLLLSAAKSGNSEEFKRIEKLFRSQSSY